MAYEFPRYLSKAKATTEQPSFLAAESTEGQITEQVGKVAGVAQEVSFKLGQAYNEAQKTQAELNQRTQIDDLLLRAEQDPDYNSYDKYRQENEKIKTQSISGFKNKITGAEARAKADYYSATADRQLQSLFHKKMIDHQQANTLGLLDLEIRNPSEETSQRIDQIVDKQQSLGFMNEKDAYVLKDKYKKQAKQNAFLSDLSVSPDLASENLGSYGFDITETSKAKKMIEAAKKKETEVFKNAQMETVNAFGEKLANKTLTQEEVQNAIATGLIDAEMGASFELAMASPDRWTEFVGTGKNQLKPSLRADNFIKPLEGIANSENVDQRMKVINSALRNRVDGKLEAQDLNFILRVANGQSKDPVNPIWGHLKSAVSSISAGPSPVKSSGEIMQKFMARWDMKKDPRYVMQEAAIDQFREDHPETAPYTVGDVIKRKSGSYEVVGYNEDGSPVFKKK